MLIVALEVEMSPLAVQMHTALWMSKITTSKEGPANSHAMK